LGNASLNALDHSPATMLTREWSRPRKLKKNAEAGAGKQSVKILKEGWERKGKNTRN
jgi:hypothetical protein